MLLMLVLMGAVVLISLPSLSEGEEDKGKLKYLKLYRHHGMGRRFIGIVLNVSWFLLLEE